MLRALQVLQEQLAVQERLVKLARAQLFQARKDLKAHRVPLDQPDHWAQQDRLALKAIKEQAHVLVKLAQINYQRELNCEPPHQVPLNRLFLDR